MSALAASSVAPKPNQKAIEQYEQQLAQNALGGFSAASDLAACLLPLLKALGWKGDPRHLLVTARIPPLYQIAPLVLVKHLVGSQYVVVRCLYN